MPVTEATYRQLAEEDFESGWELVCGRLRQKPGMTQRHNTIADELNVEFVHQLDLDRYKIARGARVRTAAGNHYVPDLCVVPRDTMEPHKDETGVETYPEPLPLVVEVWSPSTGDYDVETKVAEYQLRGDAEIWRIDPRDQSLTAWQRQPGGIYRERRFGRGVVRPASLPGVAIDLDKVFRRAWL
jgi:Uma2 family endonuclease